MAKTKSSKSLKNSLFTEAIEQEELAKHSEQEELAKHSEQEELITQKQAVELIRLSKQNAEKIPSTRGRKGEKAPRHNLTYSPENYDYIKIRSIQKGLSMAEFVNEIISLYRIIEEIAESN